MDMAEADGRLFVTDVAAHTVCVYDMALHSTARDRPIASDGAQFVTLRPRTVLTASTLFGLQHVNPYGIAATVPTASACPARVFVGSSNASDIVELTSDGTVARKFDGITRSQALALDDGDGRLLSLCHSAGVRAIALPDCAERKQKAWQMAGGIPLVNSDFARALVVISEWALVAYGSLNCVEIIPLAQLSGGPPPHCLSAVGEPPAEKRE
jgi:hypothetical protein